FGPKLEGHPLDLDLPALDGLLKRKLRKVAERSDVIGIDLDLERHGAGPPLQSARIKSQEACRSPRRWFRHCDDRFPGPHDDRLRGAPPGRLGHGGRSQAGPPAPGWRGRSKNPSPATRLDTLRVNAGMVRTSAKRKVKCGP